jgi:hypothetical protein
MKLAKSVSLNDCKKKKKKIWQEKQISLNPDKNFINYQNNFDEEK